jgi:DNA-directed RNA polymerase specialized sigma24 family protein
MSSRIRRSYKAGSSSVARNAIIDYYRTRKQTLEVPLSLPAELPENETEMEELKGVFHRLVHSLPEAISGGGRPGGV